MQLTLLKACRSNSWSWEVEIGFDGLLKYEIIYCTKPKKFKREHRERADINGDSDKQNHAKDIKQKQISDGNKGSKTGVNLAVFLLIHRNDGCETNTLVCWGK